MNIKQMWKQFIWLDSANWSGITLVDPELLSEEKNLNSDEIMNDLDKTTKSKSKNSSNNNGYEDEDSGDENNYNYHSDDNGDEGDGNNYKRNNKNRKFKGSDEYDFLDEINTEVENDIIPETNSENDQIVNDSNENKTGIDGSWDIITYLPVAAGTYLKHTIGKISLFIFYSILYRYDIIIFVNFV